MIVTTKINSIPRSQSRREVLIFITLVAASYPLLWRWERPDYFRALSCLLVILAAWVSTVCFARATRIIENPNPWLLVFLLKILFVQFILHLWFTSLEPIGMVRTHFQNPMVTDSNFYDYHAYLISSNAWNDWLSSAQSTWLSFGVILYGAIVYTLAGPSLLYIGWLNSVFVLIGLFALIGLAQRAGAPRTSGYILILFLPYSGVYDSILSKEPLTFCFFYLTLYLLYRAIDERGWGGTIILIASSVALGLVRLNALALVLMAFLLARQVPIRFRIQAALLGAVAFFGVSLYVYGQVGWLFDSLSPEIVVENAALTSLELASSGANSGLRGNVAGLLMTSNPLAYVLLTPVRALAWMVVPFPLIPVDVANFIGAWIHSKSNPYALYQQTLGLLRNLQAIVYLSCLGVIAWAWVRDRENLQRTYGALIGIFLLTAVVMSSVLLVQGSRYRLLVEPIVFLVSIGIISKNRYARQVFNILCAALLMMALTIPLIVEFS